MTEIEAEGGRCIGRALDARKEEDVTEFLKLADETAPLEVCVFNPGANVNFPILETTERVFRKVWEMACYGGFLTGREAARLMLPHGKGTILFTGATASLRGGIGYAAFASAKFGLRAVAQSMARELGPKNIHVAHLIIDAGVDTAFVRERIKARGGDEALARLEPDQLMEPESVANAYWPCTRRRATVGPSSSTSDPIGRPGDDAHRIPVRFRQPQRLSSHKVIPEIEARTGTKFEYVPVLLGGVFKLTNNKPPMVAFGGIKNKMEYEQLEMRRFIARHKLTKFQFNPNFPVNTLAIMRAAIAAQMAGELPRYADAVFGFMWETRRKMDDPEVIRAALLEAGLDADRLIAAAQTPEIKDRLMRNTAEAVDRGVFGSPSLLRGR